jgi:hypothetical protein
LKLRKLFKTNNHVLLEEAAVEQGQGNRHDLSGASSLAEKSVILKKKG